MKEDLYIAFESYFNNEMATEEKLEFEQQLQDDADMKEKFELYKETTRFLSARFDPQTIDFKKNLETIAKENATTKKNAKVIPFKQWYYAAAAVVVIALGIWFTGSGNPTYEEYGQHETANFVERSNGYMNLTDAQNAFNHKEYKKAVALFETANVYATSPELQYFYAISLIETNEYVKAESLLKSLQSGTSVYKDKAAWYLALSNLKQKKYDECKKYLHQIPADAEDYKKAQKLLKDLD